ncbi:MAG: LysE family translocator [Gammaproteobacteria bacterium]|jgi:threonine/homoserine/homoserine lactone efflux protein
MSVLIAMFSFSLAMSITPGPVNMIILSSGINYGFKKTMPYVAGANIGFILLLLAVGFVFEQFIQAYPVFLNYLAIIGSLYIIYMGYKIATSNPKIEIKKENIPKFHEGFLLQWLNPKAWIGAVSGVSIFTSADSYGPLLTFAVIYFFVCYTCLMIWAFVGDKVSVLLNNPFRIRIVNIAMGLLLIVTAVYLCYSHIK